MQVGQIQLVNRPETGLNWSRTEYKTKSRRTEKVTWQFQKNSNIHNSKILQDYDQKVTNMILNLV